MSLTAIKRKTTKTRPGRALEVAWALSKATKAPPGTGGAFSFAPPVPGSSEETSMQTHDADYRLRCSRPTVAIVGATGAVGTEFLNILARRRFPVGELRVFASPRSAGKTLTFDGHDIGIEALSEDSLTGVDLALFSAGGGTGREWALIAVRLGAIVVDNSAAFRMNLAVPSSCPRSTPPTSRATRASLRCRIVQRSSRSPRSGRSIGGTTSGG